MAAEPYNPVPTVAPAENAPNDTIRVNPTPASFGGLVAQGGQQLGAGAQRAGQFFGQVAADQASNNFQQQASDIVTNYKSLRGQQALDARPQVEKQLDDLLNSTRSTLTTPQQNLQFDDFSRRYRTYLNADIGTHYDQQQQVWMKGVHDQTIKVNLNSIAADPENADHVANAAKSVVDGYVNNARLEGTPEDAGVLTGKQVAAVTQVEAIGATNPDKALRMIDNYRDILGVQYAPLRERISAPPRGAPGAALPVTGNGIMRAHGRSPLSPAFRLAEPPRLARASITAIAYPGYRRLLGNDRYRYKPGRIAPY